MLKLQKIYRAIYERCMNEFEESFENITPFGYESLHKEADRIASEWTEYAKERILNKYFKRFISKK